MTSNGTNRVYSISDEEPKCNMDYIRAHELRLLSCSSGSTSSIGDVAKKSSIFKSGRLIESRRGRRHQKHPPNLMFLFSIFSLVVTLITMEAISGGANGVAMAQPGGPHVIAIKEGADLDLSCPIVVQNEDMIISWTCDNEPANIRSSRIHVTEAGKLRIKSAKVGDACNYRCEAADGFGTLSMIVKVIIVDKRMRDRLSRSQNRTAAIMSGAGGSGSHLTLGRGPTGSSESEDLTSSSGIGVADSTTTGAGSRETTGGQTRVQQQQQQSELEVQVEPAQLFVEKNRTFSLECKVKYPPHSLVPQIIWLKEFIGPEPNSMSEAHEQNLVIIDDVYYHGLNWPRSVSYSKQSACVNSALLVRQSSIVHSGRYICFAGYPPSIVSSFNMSLVSQAVTSPADDNNGGNNNPSSVATSPPTTMRQPLKYKMALAMVKVGDWNGKQKHQQQQQLSESELVLAPTTLPISDKRPKNLLISIFSTDSWMRNLTACLTLFCGLIIAVKLIYTRYRLNNSTASDCNHTSLSSANITTTTSSNNNKCEKVPDEICCSISANNSTNTPITQQHQPFLLLHHQPHHHHYHQTSNFSATTVQTSTSGINSTDCSQILSGASRQLEERLLGLPQLSDESSDSDHLYSEIGERDKILKPVNEFNKATHRIGADS